MKWNLKSTFLDFDRVPSKFVICSFGGCQLLVLFSFSLCVSISLQAFHNPTDTEKRKQTRIGGGG